MKYKSLISAALVAAGIISEASATSPSQVVYVTGSTAFRSTAYNSFHSAAGPGSGGIFDKPGTLVGGVTAPAITESEYGGSSQSGANYMLFRGNINGTDTIIDCAWSGSNAGIASVCNVPISNDGIALFGAPETWLLADGSLPMTGLQTVGGVVGGQPTSAQLEAASHQGDIAFADTSQASSLPQTQFNATPPQTNLKTYGGGAMCVVTFTWLKNNNSASAAGAAKTAWSDIVNISTFQAQALFGAGSLTADFFSGLAADNGTTVYLVGRNKGSGTRANVLDDCTYGVNTPVTQYAIGGHLTGTPDGTLTLTPAFDGSGVTADNGYESGGAVTTALGVAGSTTVTDPFTSAAGWIAIGYASTSDAQKNGVTTANWLTENGVFESSASVVNGQYSYWGYEHLYGRSNIGGTFADTVGTLTFNAVQFNVAGAYVGGAAAHDTGIPLTAMNASKSTDFSYPTHN
jgi:hypothetical protein